MPKAKKLHAELNVSDRTGELSVTLIDDKPITAFWKVMQHNLINLASFTDWTCHETRLLWWLMGHADLENLIKLSQGQIAMLTYIAQPQVSRSVAGLIDKHLIAKVNPVGRSFWLMLNPYIFSQVNDNFRAVLCKEWDRIHEGLELDPYGKNAPAARDNKALAVSVKDKKRVKALRFAGKTVGMMPTE